jgi:Tol biopolymer transport system component
MSGEVRTTPAATPLHTRDMRLGLVWLLFAACVAISPALAHATFPGRNGRIAYLDDGSKRQLHSINPDGSDDQVLSRFGSDVRQLVWAPDGQRVLYTRILDNTRNSDIWSADPDGRNQRLVIGGDAPDSFPAWSPDGSQILFVRADSSNTQWVTYIAGADGSNPRPLLDQPSCSAGPAADYRCPALASWSSRGRIAILSDRSGPTEIWAINPDGSDPVQLTTGPGRRFESFDWSPDGARLVFTRIDPFEMSIVNADGSGQVDVSGLLGTPGNPNGSPVWSPDGTELAFVRGGTAPQFMCCSSEVFTARPDGVLLGPVTNDSNVLVATDPTWQPLPAGGTGGSGPSANPRLRISSRKIVIRRRGAVRIRLGCVSPGPGKVCRGTVRVATARKVACRPVVAKKKQVGLGTGRYRIRAGRSAAVRLRVPKLGRRLMSCLGRARARVRATAVGSDGVSKTFTAFAVAVAP